MSSWTIPLEYELSFATWSTWATWTTWTTWTGVDGWMDAEPAGGPERQREHYEEHFDEHYAVGRG